MNRSIYYFNPFTTSNKNSAVENLYYMHACSYSNSRSSKIPDASVSEVFYMEMFLFSFNG